MNILFTCAGRRTYLLKYFRSQLSASDKIVATDMQLSAPALTVADEAIVVPAVYSPNYIDRTIEICREQQIKMLISLNDLELPIISANLHRFKEIGVMPIVSSSDVIDTCFDKDKTAKFLKNLGLNVPETYTNLSSAIKSLKNGSMKFPLMVKPRWGSGSIGIESVDDFVQLKLAYQMARIKVKKSILSKASIGDEFILIQEKIVGPEYGLDIINDLNGQTRSVSVKRKLAMRAGETDKAITVDNAEIREIGTIISKALGHIGNLDCDILERDGKYYVLELNPRFGGGFPFSYEAGVNLPKALIEWVNGNDIDDNLLIPRYGETYAKNDYLVKCKQ